MSFKTKLIKTGVKILASVKKHGPTIMVVAGVAGSIVATVEAVKGTLKAEEAILVPAQKEFELIDKATETNPEYTDKDRRTDRAAVYIRSAGRFVKTYWKAIAAWAVSIGLIIGAHAIQANRLSNALNLAAGAVTALSAMTDNTRQTFGDEVAMALRTGKDIPEAVDRLDIEKVKECAANKIRYSDPFRSYGNQEEQKDIPVDYKVNTGDPMMLKYDTKHIKSSYWYDNPVTRLSFLKSTEQFLNTQLESGAVNKISIKDVRDALGYIDDDESPNDVMLGWWADGAIHPIDFGLAYLFDILESHKLDSPDRVAYELDYVMIDDGHDCKRDWYLILNPMGDLYKRTNRKVV